MVFFAPIYGDFGDDLLLFNPHDGKSMKITHLWRIYHQWLWRIDHQW
jgi:hypothetical protein